MAECQNITCYINFVDHHSCFHHSYVALFMHADITKICLGIIFCQVIHRYAIQEGGVGGEARRKMKVSQPGEGRSVRGVKEPKENFQTSEQFPRPHWKNHCEL